ncbi:low molecular weight protein arginine phosphatase [Sporosarcina sp. Sa2YVA2]|uniref:Low molecular weight protein arginine phosphatase n=1 Tax=Sporosarcina quadrami TaxID=2762234 RepID=A0ABR8U9E5_9BACL|nr:low molecular weight protein arginine phosphatase [Sporosarcina quadrami]MBD7984646.1 low molecular weight protein arginine phosphatase [Sporosarcina quadrami]
MNIYFICTGNTCRSPMAEAILRSKQIEGVDVRSAGVHAVDGLPISANALTLIEQSDMPYTPVSTAVTAERLAWADLILTMTSSHKRLLLHSFPSVAEKTFTLKEYTLPAVGGDVHDPYGGNLETYRKTFGELESLIEKLKQKLLGEEA